jgi:hypothetical protein
MPMLSPIARHLDRSQVVETAAAKTSSFAPPPFLTLPESSTRQALAGQAGELPLAAGAENA